MSRSIVSAVFVLASGASASAQMNFHPAVHYPVGQNPAGGVLLDFTGDGQLDLVVSSDHPDKLEFLANLGNAILAAPIPLPTANGSKPEGLVSGDFDADGDVDLLAALFGADAVQLVLNDGSGNFALGASFAVGTQPTNIVAADLNGDGFLDAAVQNRASDDASVLLNDGAGGFAPAVSYPVGIETRGIAVGDLTGDGLPDLAVTARDSLRIRVLWNIGGGAFQTLVDLSYGSFLKPHGVLMVDFDHDGDLDILASAESNSPAFRVVSVFKNFGGTNFQGPVNGVCGGLGPTAIVARDFDLDGNFDVATADADSNDVSANKGDGYYFFFAPAVFQVGTSPEALLAGDLDGDGSDDLVAIDHESDEVSILVNANDPPSVGTAYCFGDGTTATPCPCGNLGGAGRGCENSASTGGALLAAAGSTHPDTLVLTSSGELPSALSIFLQGSTVDLNGVVFGDGIRCTAGSLKRLYAKNAIAGTVSAPTGSEPSVSARSAALGDAIPPGATRSYQVYYRDPNTAFCAPPSGASFNVSGGLQIAW